MTTKFLSFLFFTAIVPTCLFCLTAVSYGQDLNGKTKGRESDDGSSLITPESMGFTPFTLETDDGVVRYYLSSGGGLLNEKVVRPLVMFLDGSGPSPVFWGKGNRLGSSLMFGPEEFPDFHYVVISKPGVEFHETERRIESKEYDRTMSLPWRVKAANAVINKLATEKYVDSSLVLVIGHSEGADVAPWVAAGNQHVTHVAGLAPGGVSQMFDFVLFVRKKVEAGELTKGEGDVQIREIKKAYRDIFAEPKNTDKKWEGETYLRWSTFFRPAMEAWCQIEVPVYLGYCRDDKNTPVECGEAIELEFIRLGKKNLTSKQWPTNHHFQEVPGGEGAEAVDRRLEVLGEVVSWARRAG